MKLSNLFILLFLLSACGTSSTVELDDDLGLMLYTIREEMKEDPKEKLNRVAEIGYEYIESAGYENGLYYGMTPTDFKSYMESIDLDPMSSHQDSMTYENADQEIADAVAAGFKFVVIPVPPMGMFTYNFETRTMGMKGSPEELVAFLNTVGEKAANAGLSLLYHNHDFEFKPNDEGLVLAEYILENTDPRYVNFQLDLYWATVAGADIKGFINKYQGRIKAFHVKDMNEDGSMAPVGQGKIDFVDIFTLRNKAGLEFFVAEQDYTGEISPMEAIVISHEGLEAIAESFGSED